MTLRIHHYRPLRATTADAVHAVAIEESLARRLGPRYGAIHFIGKPIHRRFRAADEPSGLVKANIEDDNAKADLVLLSGAGLLDPSRSRHGGGTARSGGWSVEIDLRWFDRLRKPFVTYGVGTTLPDAPSETPFHRGAAAEVRAVFQQASAVSVVDDAAARRLDAVGVRDVAIADPASLAATGDVGCGRRCGPLLVAFPAATLLRSEAGRRTIAGIEDRVQTLLDGKIPFIAVVDDRRDRALAHRLTHSRIRVVRNHDHVDAAVRVLSSRAVIAFQSGVLRRALGLGRAVVPLGVRWERAEVLAEIMEGPNRALTERWSADDRKLWI
ncbi:MAG: hypothetical protein ACRDD1_05795, partial [Planctomycetia bacterium]